MRDIHLERMGELSGPILDQLKKLIQEMQDGMWTKMDSAVLITKDEDTGIITFVHMTKEGIDDHKMLFNEAATILGYGIKRVN